MYYSLHQLTRRKTVFSFDRSVSTQNVFTVNQGIVFILGQKRRETRHGKGMKAISFSNSSIGCCQLMHKKYFVKQ